MHATYKNALMWTLYGAFFLLLTVLQTVVFGRARFFDVKLSILPVCIACVAMLCGAQKHFHTDAPTGRRCESAFTLLSPRRK